MDKPGGFIEECLKEALARTLLEHFGLDISITYGWFEAEKLKVSRTPDKKLGDYSIALHYFFKELKQPSGEWDRIAEKIIAGIREKFSDKCFIREASFVNGYLNIRIDFDKLSKLLLPRILSGDVFRDLAKIGGGKHVIVEHTSANPVHPLHIGSGRNSVIGDTFSRLLAKLGFRVTRRFYVNDMGKQVAILTYGVSILEKNNVKPLENMKRDHWYGIVYALTNLVIEEKRFLRYLSSLEADLWRTLEDFVNTVRAEGLISLEDLEELDSVLAKKTLKHDSAKLFRKTRELLSKYQEKLSTHRSFNELWSKIEEYLKAWREYLKLMRQIAELAKHAPDAYIALSSSIVDYEKAIRDIRELMKRCEEESPEILSLFNRVSREVVEGFKETLSKLGIEFDGFDWESSREILQLAHSISREAESRGFARREEGALLVDLDKASEENEFISELFKPDKPGKFIIERSDGTTLYVTRDIAYTIYKFRDLKAEIVYNVIASEQTREQKQVKAVLYLLGYDKEAKNLIHFVYELVRLKGLRMSGRRGVYYTLDELVRDYYSIVSKIYYKTLSGPKGGTRGAGKEVLEALAVANARSLLLSVEPLKVLVFDPSRLEEQTMGSTILYSYVRVQSILRKLTGLEPLDNLEKIASIALEGDWSGYQPSLVEEELLSLLGDYDKVLVSSYNSMKPNRIIEYAVNLSNTLNKFYETHRVIGEKDPRARAFRIALVTSSLLVLKELVDILGFPHVRTI
ncbi:arginine--tRNA ligase domain-containing protein [Thermogladius sp. 4427co]|uniref:arginine--tRNA ligase domain-containing protein n=1 Tax=Thermogladius sp. 4427co TaxID=3450718 RepID=UPI003F78BD60